MEKIVGFDIGESSVKLVYFAGADLKKAVTAELPDNMVSGSRILSMDAMADFLRQMAKSNGIPLTHAALVLPSTEVFTRELVMPAMTEQQLLYNLPYEFRDYLTEEKNKYFFDYSMREVLRDESGQPTEMNLLACAALAAVFTVSAMAAYQLWGPGELFDPFFTIESAPLNDGQKALLDEIGTTDLPPVTSGGTTLTPLAAIADEHTLKPLQRRRFRGILSIAK